ncbi:RWP-RK domain-containing protein [Artemisia annua]|uniref:RWP-RK domain-containing protein n=1 Tax=Artemisia annua TaxID=35608 RepID=A0A2U1N307_ARTAN|nr:RWP-RK domain-containing protein [Artemisia annua]
MACSTLNPKVSSGDPFFRRTPNFNFSFGFSDQTVKEKYIWFSIFTRPKTRLTYESTTLVLWSKKRCFLSLDATMLDLFVLCNITDIHVSTTEELKQKIIFIIRNSPIQGQNVLVQYWAAKQTGKTSILTTTCQPFGLYGINQQLDSYRKGCLDHKLYVYVDPKILDKGVAVGLPGRAFLNCTPEQTRNVHDIPKEQRPPCEDAIFSKVWGSFAVPVIVDGRCVGVLDFVMDTSEDSYDIHIGEICKLLQHAGLQSAIQTDCPRRACISINGRKRIRKTQSFPHTYYFRLVPHFGLSSVAAAEKLGLTKGTFRNACRNVGIPEWPAIPSTNIRVTRTSCAPESRYSQTLSETGSSGISVADSICSSDEGSSEWSRERTQTPIASSSENQTNQTVSETSLITDDLSSYWVIGRTNSHDQRIYPKTEMNQIASPTSYTKALLKSEYDETAYQGNEMTVIEDLDHHTFVESLAFVFEDAPEMTSIT